MFWALRLLGKGKRKQPTHFEGEPSILRCEHSVNFEPSPPKQQKQQQQKTQKTWFSLWLPIQRATWMGKLLRVGMDACVLLNEYFSFPLIGGLDSWLASRCPSSPQIQTINPNPQRGYLIWLITTTGKGLCPSTRRELRMKFIRRTVPIRGSVIDSRFPGSCLVFRTLHSSQLVNSVPQRTWK